jgi:hypothetical protein
MTDYDHLERADAMDMTADLHEAMEEEITALRAERDRLAELLASARAQCDSAQAEVRRMRPVVEAAERWADSFTGTDAHDALDAAVDAYRKARP